MNEVDVADVNGKVNEYVNELLDSWIDSNE